MQSRTGWRAETLAIVAMGMALLPPLPARAEDPGRGMPAMRSAAKYAAAAAAARNLASVRANLQRALNCLEGPHGADYRRRAGDRCPGSGAVNELPEGSADETRVIKAIRLAAIAVTFHNFAPAHFTAQAIEAVLREGVGERAATKP